MKITWKITKKRGNWRPVCEYTIEKTQEEVDLAINTITFNKTPFPEFSRYIDEQKKSWDEKEERSEGWKPEKFCTVETPHADSKLHRHTEFLPWKPGANPEYPEVEEFFRHVQAVYDEKFKVAYESGTIEITKNLDHTKLVKEKIAPMVAARKMLNK